MGSTGPPVEFSTKLQPTEVIFFNQKFGLKRILGYGNNNSESETTDTRLYGLKTHDTEDTNQGCATDQQQTQMDMFAYNKGGYEGTYPNRLWMGENNNSSENNTAYDPAMGNNDVRSSGEGNGGVTADAMASGTYPPRNENIPYLGFSPISAIPKIQAGSESEQNRSQGTGLGQEAKPKSGFSDLNSGAIPMPHSNMITNTLGQGQQTGSDDDPEKWKVNYINSPYAIKLMLSNSTDNYYSFSLRILAGEQVQFYFLNPKDKPARV